MAAAYTVHESSGLSKTRYLSIDNRNMEKQNHSLRKPLPSTSLFHNSWNALLSQNCFLILTFWLFESLLLVFFYSHSSNLFSFLLWISCISPASSSLSIFTSSSSCSLTFFYPFLILLPLPLIRCGFNHCQAALKSPSDWHFLPERRGICDCGKLTTKTQHIQFSAQFLPFFCGNFAWD